MTDQPIALAVSDAASGAVPEAVPEQALQKILMDAGATEAIREEDPNGNRWYTYPPTGQPLVSVTTVLGATWDESHKLVPWAAKLAAEYATRQLPALLALYEGGKGRDAVLGAIKGQAKRLREVKREAGVHAHDVIQALALWGAADHGDQIDLPPLPEELADADMDGVTLAEFVDAVVTGFMNFVADFDVTIEASETTVYNVEYGYAGTLDLIVYLGRHKLRLVIDAKTGKHLKKWMAAQMAPYRRASEVLIDNIGNLAPMPQVDGCAVLHLRPEFPRGYRLRLLSEGEDRQGWTNFRTALNLYNGYTNGRDSVGTVLSPLGEDGRPLPMLLGDLEGYGAGIKALIRAGHSTIADVARLTRSQCLAVKGVGEKTIEGIESALKDNNLAFVADEAVA